MRIAPSAAPDERDPGAGGGGLRRVRLLSRRPRRGGFPRGCGAAVAAAARLAARRAELGLYLAGGVVRDLAPRRARCATSTWSSRGTRRRSRGSSSARLERRGPRARALRDRHARRSATAGSSTSRPRAARPTRTRGRSRRSPRAPRSRRTSPGGTSRSTPWRSSSGRGAARIDPFGGRRGPGARRRPRAPSRAPFSTIRRGPSARCATRTGSAFGIDPATRREIAAAPALRALGRVSGDRAAPGDPPDLRGAAAGPGDGAPRRARASRGPSTPALRDGPAGRGPGRPRGGARPRKRGRDDLALLPSCVDGADGRSRSRARRRSPRARRRRGRGSCGAGPRRARRLLASADVASGTHGADERGRGRSGAASGADGARCSSGAASASAIRLAHPGRGPAGRGSAGRPGRSARRSPRTLRRAAGGPDRGEGRARLRAARAAKETSVTTLRAPARRGARRRPDADADARAAEGPDVLRRVDPPVERGLRAADALPRRRRSSGRRAADGKDEVKRETPRRRPRRSSTASFFARNEIWGLAAGPADGPDRRARGASRRSRSRGRTAAARRSGSTTSRPATADVFVAALGARGAQGDLPEPARARRRASRRTCSPPGTLLQRFDGALFRVAHLEKDTGFVEIEGVNEPYSQWIKIEELRFQFAPPEPPR